jgi:hypothetical protein
MKIIGFSFTKNDLRYAVLEFQDSEEIPKIIDKNKITYPKRETSELMEWFETQLCLIIDKHTPNQLAYKISLTLPTLDQIRLSCYPQAILNLISRKKRLPIFCYSSQAINASKFGQPKKTDVYAFIDTLIGTHPPYWDKATKEAVLVGWFTAM